MQIINLKLKNLKYFLCPPTNDLVYFNQDSLNCLMPQNMHENSLDIKFGVKTLEYYLGYIPAYDLGHLGLVSTKCPCGSDTLKLGNLPFRAYSKNLVTVGHFLKFVSIFYTTMALLD